MGKARRKPRPSMPRWWWLEQDGCWFCKNKNNCNSCGVNKREAKAIRKHRLRQEQREIKKKT